MDTHDSSGRSDEVHRGVDRDLPQRDRETTERRLIDAAIGIIRDEGFDRLGINAVAQRAGVSKVLIYRYFGDLSGLLKAVAEELDPLQSKVADRLMSTITDAARPGDIFRSVVMELHQSLENDELSKQLMIWELSNSNAVTEAMSEAREEVGLALTERSSEMLENRELPEELDLHALFAIISATVSYLTLRSSAVRCYNGIDLRSSEGWNRIASTMKFLIDSLENSPERNRNTSA